MTHTRFRELLEAFARTLRASFDREIGSLSAAEQRSLHRRLDIVLDQSSDSGEIVFLIGDPADAVRHAASIETRVIIAFVEDDTGGRVRVGARTYPFEAHDDSEYEDDEPDHARAKLTGAWCMDEAIVLGAERLAKAFADLAKARHLWWDDLPRAGS